ncbi:MAG: hypothetical protein MI919_31385, partial [Holophagales bacterium]|nr:hypothetical protein [Holophagales bacterium]
PLAMLALAIGLMLLLGVTTTVAQDPGVPAAEGPRSLHLLDRGDSGDPGTTGPPMTMMATLAVGSATPGVTSISVVGSASMVTQPAFYGNFFTAPSEIPPGWYPFEVTGVFAWHNFAPSPPGSLFLGAGVAPGPFPGDMGTMWAAFGTAMVPVPPFMTPAVIGAPGNLSPALPVPSPMPFMGVACGLLTSPTGPGGGPLLGAIVPPASPLKDAQSFNGPPFGPDFLVPEPPIGLFIQWVAGCYVSGATVPVELQSFTIE